VPHGLDLHRPVHRRPVQLRPLGLPGHEGHRHSPVPRHVPGGIRRRGFSRPMQRLPPVHARLPVRGHRLQCRQPEGGDRLPALLRLWHLPFGLQAGRDLPGGAGGRRHPGHRRQRADVARGVGHEPPGRPAEPRSPGRAGRARLGCGRSRQARRGGALQRPAAVAARRGRQGSRDPRSLVSRAGVRPRDRGGDLRRRQPGRQAADHDAPVRRPRAGVLQPQAVRAARVPVRLRRAALRVRVRPELHHVRVREPQAGQA